MADTPFIDEAHMRIHNRKHDLLDALGPIHLIDSSFERRILIEMVNLTDAIMAVGLEISTSIDNTQ